MIGTFTLSVKAAAVSLIGGTIEELVRYRLGSPTTTRVSARAQTPTTPATLHLLHRRWPGKHRMDKG